MTELRIKIPEDLKREIEIWSRLVASDKENDPKGNSELDRD